MSSEFTIQRFLIEEDFIIPSNQLYGGLEGVWDYGHNGVLLKKNLIDTWSRFFVDINPNVFWLDCALLGSEKMWTSSGHISNFHDILLDCKKCKKRMKEDELNEKSCPFCDSQDLTAPKEFNLMFKVGNQYLRPETAQNIFINYKKILSWNHRTLPVGGAQIGKAFRNEITVHHGIFKTKEFNQMELEWFCTEKDASNIFEKCLGQMNLFLGHLLQLSPKNFRTLEVPNGEGAHYAKKTVDMEFNFPHGWGELWGLSNRGKFDLTNHFGKPVGEITSENATPFVVEHSIGLDRLFYAVISNFYKIEVVNDKERVILQLPPFLAPYKITILPMTKNEVEIGRWLSMHLMRAELSIGFEYRGSIGKRYLKQDAIGTPLCISIDSNNGLHNQPLSKENLDTLILTIRERDSRKQERMTYKEFIEGRIREAISK